MVHREPLGNGMGSSGLRGAGQSPTPPPGSQTLDTEALGSENPSGPWRLILPPPTHSVALWVSGKPQGTLWAQSGCSQAKFSSQIEGVR